MDRSLSASQSSRSTRSSGSRSSEEGTTTPRNQLSGTTVNALEAHETIGFTRSAELDKLRGLKVHLGKFDEKLTSEVPEGVSDAMRNALQEAIHGFLRAKGTVPATDRTRPFAASKVKKIKTAEGNKYAIRYKINPGRRKDARDWANIAIGRLIVQSNCLRLTEAQCIELLKEPRVMTPIFGGC
jgi:hypothetical protein